MADFCQQCAIETFGEDIGDLAGITTEEQEAKGLYCVVLCEGCGMTQVDSKGRCVNDCLLKHGVEKADE
jgi:hypothetical protein